MRLSPLTEYPYLRDSNSEKQECLRRIENVISECKKQIEEAERLAQIEIERKKGEERKRLMEERRVEEELQRIRQDKEEIIKFIYNIPDCVFPTEMFWLILEHLDQISEEGINVLLSNIESNIRYFEADAINKWLKVVCEIVNRKNDGIQTAKYLWDEIIYSFEKRNNRIKYLSLKNYFAVMGISDYSRALKLLIKPIDDDTSNWLSSISPSNPDFEYYAPLIILNRYYQAERNIPERIANFFAERTKEIWCLISAQQGESFGYEKMNLKQVTNLVCNSYSDIASLFLHLIDRNGYAPLLSEVKTKPGKKPVNHYQRLKECVANHPLPHHMSLRLEELNIMFPKKKKANAHQ